MCIYIKSVQVYILKVTHPEDHFLSFLESESALRGKLFPFLLQKARTEVRKLMRLPVYSLDLTHRPLCSFTATPELGDSRCFPLSSSSRRLTFYSMKPTLCFLFILVSLLPLIVPGNAQCSFESLVDQRIKEALSRQGKRRGKENPSLMLT